MDIIMIPMKTLPINAYCQLTGMTRRQIDKRISRGVWREGVEVIKVEGSRERYIDLEEVDKWVRQYKCSEE